MTEKNYWDHLLHVQRNRIRGPRDSPIPQPCSRQLRANSPHTSGSNSGWSTHRLPSTSRLQLAWFCSPAPGIWQRSPWGLRVIVAWRHVSSCLSFLKFVSVRDMTPICWVCMLINSSRDDIVLKARPSKVDNQTKSNNFSWRQSGSKNQNMFCDRWLVSPWKEGSLAKAACNQRWLSWLY